MCVENEIKSLLVDMLVENSERAVSVTDLVNKYSAKLLPICERVYEQANNHRYYLSGVLEDGEEYFLVSALSEKRAVEDAEKYLSGHWKFSKILITTADGSYKKEVVRGQ